MSPSDHPSDPKDGFNARLQSALKRAGTTGQAAERTTGSPDSAQPAKTPKNLNAMPSNAWGVGGRVGVEIVSAFIAGTGLGWLLDHWLHTMPVFLILGVVFGGAAGIWNVWRLIRQ